MTHRDLALRIALAHAANRPPLALPERDDPDFRRLMDAYREARDEEDDAASRAASLRDEIEERFGVDAEGER